jgi:hypothetical protein
MKRRNRGHDAAMTANAQPQGIPPWIDNFGRPVWNNPWNQYRPNTQGLTAEPVAVAPVIEPAHVPAPQVLAPQVLAPQAAAAPTAPDPRAAIDALLESGEFDRIRGTLQYAKGYAKACKALGLEVPAEFQDRLRDQLAARRNRVHKRVRRTVVTAAAVSAGAVGMNAAAAYFTSSGSGTGAASTGTVTVSVSATTGTPSTALYPGSTADVTLEVNNPNAFAVTLKKVEGNGTITASGGKGSCPAPTGVTFTDQTALNQTLPANSTDNAVDLTGAAAMDIATADNCQGATFTIPVKVTVQKP